MPIPDKMPYDTWLAYTAASISHINYVDEPLTNWRQHQDSFTAVMLEKQAKKENKNRKYDEYQEKLQRIELLKDNGSCSDKAFMTKLYSAYRSLENGFS